MDILSLRVNVNYREQNIETGGNSGAWKIDKRRRKPRTSISDGTKLRNVVEYFVFKPLKHLYITPKLWGFF